MFFDTWRRWLKQAFAGSRLRTPMARPRYRPNLEALEDRLVPASTAVAIEYAGNTVTNASSVNFTVVFESAATTGLVGDDLLLTGTAVSGATTIGTITPNGSNTQDTVQVNGLAGANGTLILSLVSVAGGTGLSNTVTNTLPVASPTITLDNTAPLVSISAPTVSATTITYTVTYTDSQTLTIPLTASDITVNGGSATVAVSGSGTTSPATRTVTLSNVTGAGPLGISIAADSAVDAAGNQAPATGPSATVGLVTVSSISHTSPTATVTAATSLTYTLTFSAATTGLTASNFSLSGTAASSGTVGTPTTTDNGLEWTVPVTVTSGASGTLTLVLANSTGLSNFVTTTLPFAGDTYTLNSSAAAPVFTSAKSAFFSAGAAGSFQVKTTATPSVAAYTLVGAPSWLHINATTGQITGTPPVDSAVLEQVFEFTIDAKNAVSTTAQTFTLTVTEPRRRGAA